ncbi:MAG: hypothetical protein WC451_06175 [Patescibacteria group bacterium]|jgi:hypothetical protein
MGTRGGKRPGGGRPKGKKNAETLEREAVEKAVNQRIFKIANKLINSQAVLAFGSITVLQKIEWKEGKEKKSKLVVVEDVETITKVLEETNGEGGVVDENLYIVATNKPENQAITSLMDRAFGKAAQKNFHSGPDGGDIKFSLTDEQADKIFRRRAGGVQGSGQK